MGFLSMLGDLIGGAMKAMEEHAKEMEKKLETEYRSRNPKDLLGILVNKQENSIKRIAALRALKQRFGSYDGVKEQLDGFYFSYEMDNHYSYGEGPRMSDEQWRYLVRQAERY